MNKKTIDKICSLLNELSDLKSVEYTMKVKRGEAVVKICSEEYRQRLEIKVLPAVLERIALKVIDEVEAELKELGYTEDE